MIKLILILSLALSHVANAGSFGLRARPKHTNLANFILMPKGFSSHSTTVMRSSMNGFS